MKMKKIEKKIAKLEEKKLKEPSTKLDKKIMKLEKKKVKLEKWLKIKLPFRILIKGLATWLIIGGVCYGCSYVPVLKEVKMVAMATISYVAPEPVATVLDIVTLNVGVNNNDFEWLKTTLMAYMNEEIELETNYTDNDIGTGYTYDGTSYIYTINGQQVTEEEYNQYISKKNEELENMAQEVLGTTDVNEMSSMSISDILIKVATNATPEIVSQFLDTSNLTDESKQRLEQDINRALKIIPKLNNNQMNELVEIISSLNNKSQVDAETMAKVQKMSEDFIENTRTTGKITYSSYNQLVSNLNSTGDTYDISLEIKVLDDNPGSGVVIGENTFYSIYTPQILDEVNNGGAKMLKEGDIIRVQITSLSTGVIVAEYSGMITVNGK